MIKRYRVRVSDDDGVIFLCKFWTRGGAISYLHNWVAWYGRKYIDTPLLTPALYVRVETFIAGRWIILYSSGHYEYMNELVRRGVIL